MIRLRKPRPGVDQPPLRADQAWLLLGTAAITVLPHTPELPAWLSAVCAILLGWRAWLVPRGARAAARLPARWLIALIGAGITAGVVLDYRSLFGKDPGLALLAALLCLKLLEGGRARDARAALFLGFFLQLGLFLNTQSLPIAGAALGGTLFALATLNALHDSPQALPERLRTAGLLLAQGLPLMLLFFLLFPRIPGPLWGLPADAHSAQTGLSDRMEPGSISQLSQSDAIAFRARFIGPQPPPAQLYWRGPVLSRFDGEVWSPLPPLLGSEPRYTPQGPAYRYELTLEPHNQRWLLALDYPAGGADGLYGSDFQLLARAPIRARVRYELVSHPQTPVGLDETPGVLRAALQLPSGGNPRARKLAAQLAEGASDHAEILRRTLAHFIAADLAYTLRPPLMRRDSVDAFLFEHQRGFCEHFASAFAFVLRAAGVPARVVVGYQGGEINPVDQVLQVRQSAAHAWNEVWLAGRGWVRVDPTAASHPRRLDDGLLGALPDGERISLFYRADLRWLHDLRYRWEALNSLWNQQVLGYNRERQRDLLRKLGFGAGDWRELVLLLGLLSAAALAALLVWAHRQRAQSDPLDRAWARLNARMSRVGLGRQPWEGPLAWAERIEALDAQRGARLRPLAQAYARLRYGPPADRNSLRALQKQLRKFRP